MELKTDSSHASQNLFEAVQKGRLAEVRERLENGEDVNAVHVISRTALHIAASESNAKVVELLLQYNPDLKVRVLPQYFADEMGTDSCFPAESGCTR